jgi:diaminohydroxyphosphoribosylaminopyrimidine deaminase/5-amino-6-(5-phosphoribosylamino)uracil reductase
MLNAAFFKRMKLGMPLVTAKWAMTLDGRIAAPDGSSKWISDEDSRRQVHALRGEADAVLVGIGTTAADDPELTCRVAEAKRTAARVVADPHCRLPLTSRLVATIDRAPLLVATGPEADTKAVAALREAGAEVIVLAQTPEGGLDLRQLMKGLGDRGMSNVLVEGGARILGSLVDQGLIDRVVVFVAPKLLGSAGGVPPIEGVRARTMAEALALAKVSIVQGARDAIIQGWLTDPMAWCVPG